MEHAEIDALLNDSKTSLLEAYMRLQQYYEGVYGPDTVLLMEVGSFFEVYGVDNEQETIGKTREIADLLNIQLTRKNKQIKENNVKNPLMAGFPTATFDRYVTRMIAEKKYTIVIIRQDGVPPKVTRHVDRILSPGVNIDYCLDHEDNYVSSLVVDAHQGVYSVGYAAIDVSTGKTYLFEGHSTKEDPTAALDELFRLLQSHTHSERIVTLGSKDIDAAMLFDYLEIADGKKTHVREKRLSVSYQNELFKKAYVVKSFLSPIEFLNLEKQPLTSEALAQVIEFIVDHDVRVIENLKKPTIIQTANYLYLGNNPLEQLNIISRDPLEKTVLRLFDYTSTSIGKRLFRDRLTNPITNKEEIEARYNLSDWLSPIHTTIGFALKKVYDLERIDRRIRLGRLHPYEINFLYSSLQATAEIVATITRESNEAILPQLLGEQDNIADYISFLEKTFDLDETAKVLRQAISKSIFQPGFDREVDELVESHQQLVAQLEVIREKFVTLLDVQSDRDHDDFVLIKQLDKEGHYISMTKSRYALIEDVIRDQFISIENTVYALSDFSYKVQTSNVKITSPLIDRISKEIVVIEHRLVALTKRLFDEQLRVIAERFYATLDLCTSSLAMIDVAISNVRASAALRLVRPEIVDPPEGKAYLSCRSLRHPLVESREEHGIYVPNDVVLGARATYGETDLETVIASQSKEDVRGVLLYGINSSGKSSLMKSVGVAVILAQSGLFVPASAMRFSLCTELFTRILARDNFEKGLSSFAVEMVELKNIFNRCGPRSLILGDEISHGTETLSAIAIVCAAIERLTENHSLFLFTTHLHQIHNIAMLSKNPHVVSVHLCVHYDSDHDRLVFDRVLQPGSGSSVYGLEFAESLHMDPTFLQYARSLRKELAHDYTDIELLTKKQRSLYHKDVFLTVCAVCKGKVEDVHHISPQQEADAHGNIGHIHKNHKYNLLPICKDCHKKVHDKQLHITGFMMTSEGLELSFERTGDPEA